MKFHSEKAYAAAMADLCRKEGKCGMPPTIKDVSAVRGRAVELWDWVAANPRCTKAQMRDAFSLTVGQHADLMISLSGKLRRVRVRGTDYYEVNSASSLQAGSA